MVADRGGQMAVRAGVLCGVVLGCLTGAQLTLAIVGVGASALGNLNNGLLLAGFIAFFLVGLVVRRRTGSVEAGVRAGALAGVTTGLMACAGAIMLDAVAPESYAAATAQTTQPAIGVGAAFFAGLLNLATQAGLGAGLGLMGALAGRPRAMPQHHASIPSAGGMPTTRPEAG